MADLKWVAPIFDKQRLKCLGKFTGKARTFIQFALKIVNNIQTALIIAEYDKQKRVDILRQAKIRIRIQENLTLRHSVR